MRAALAHAVDTESAFLSSITLGLEAVRAGGSSERPDDETWRARRIAGEEPAGSRADALNALARSHIRILRGLAGVTDWELDTPSYFWEDEAFPIRFRMHRFEEHLRQHTIQVDKTLAAPGHPPTEAERLVRNLHVALAGVEMGAFDDGRELLDRCAVELDDLAAQVERASRG